MDLAKKLILALAKSQYSAATIRYGTDPLDADSLRDVRGRIKWLSVDGETAIGEWEADDDDAPIEISGPIQVSTSLWARDGAVGLGDLAIDGKRDAWLGVVGTTIIAKTLTPPSADPIGEIFGDAIG